MGGTVQPADVVSYVWMMRLVSPRPVLPVFVCGRPGSRARRSRPRRGVFETDNYTFASKVAAIQDQYADASIGNVTGSNAVNVFLGIGVAWSIAAIYHHSRGNQFLVDPGNLAFSVTLFTIFAFICVSVLMYRRRPEIGGELGGPRTPKVLTSLLFISLWLLYILFSSLEAYCHVKGAHLEVTAEKRETLRREADARSRSGRDCAVGRPRGRSAQAPVQTQSSGSSEKPGEPPGALQPSRTVHEAPRDDGLRGGHCTLLHFIN
ncbi:Na+/Ca2+ exchanger-like [Arapaima gigas]